MHVCSNIVRWKYMYVRRIIYVINRLLWSYYFIFQIIKCDVQINLMLVHIILINYPSCYSLNIHYFWTTLSRMYNEWTYYFCVDKSPFKSNDPVSRRPIRDKTGIVLHLTCQSSSSVKVYVIQHFVVFAPISSSFQWLKQDHSRRTENVNTSLFIRIQDTFSDQCRKRVCVIDILQP